MRRAVTALVATAAGVVALLQYRTPPLPPLRQIARPTPTTRVLAAAPPPPTPARVVAVVKRTAAPTARPLAPAKRPAAPPPVRTAPPHTSTPQPKPTTAPASHTYTGVVTMTQYGSVQVQITVSGSRITDVQALQMPNDTARSQQISDYAAPKLRQEALDAQSSNIDTVSGATYTSDGYRQTLQSAIDQWKPAS